MGVNPRVEKHKLWIKSIQHIRKLITNSGKIVIIFGTIGEGNIKIAVHFPKGKITRSMYRKSSDAFIRLKTCGRSIALVHIQIHDQDPVDFATLEQDSCGHSTIIKNAKAAAKVRMSMMCAACQVTGESMPKRQACRQ